MIIQSLNPSTGAVNKEFEAVSGAEAIKEAKAVAKECKKAFKKWRKLKLSERLDYIGKLAQVLRKNKSEYAQLITKEMGKPIKDSEHEIEKCAEICDYYITKTVEFLKDESAQTVSGTDLKSELTAVGSRALPNSYALVKSYVTFEPLGVILAIKPWNYPFSQAFRTTIPAIAAGNTVVLRHSNIVPQCALAIEQAFVEAGFPENIFRSIITDYNSAAALIRSRQIAAVSFTGSTESGAKVSAIAGKYLKKCVMELGGSDPFIVLKDADISKAAEAAAESRFKNCGQACNASKRFIVVEEKLADFEHAFIEKTRKYAVGDPSNPATQIGPLVREDQRKTIEEQVADALSKGARLLIGGKRMEGNGFFYMPTILSDIKPNMRIFKEEVFGPVASIIAAKSDSQAISIANKTEYGLGAIIWTSNPKRGEKLAKRLEAGIVSINGKVSADPAMPFGGVKKSGFGRELSHYGLKEFVNIKSVKVFTDGTQTQKKSEKKPAIQ